MLWSWCLYIQSAQSGNVLCSPYVWSFLCAGMFCGCSAVLMCGASCVQVRWDHTCTQEGDFFLRGMKRPGRKAERWLQSSATVQSEWRCTYIPHSGFTGITLSALNTSQITPQSTVWSSKWALLFRFPKLSMPYFDISFPQKKWTFTSSLKF
jgi:hypothetical protein